MKKLPFLLFLVFLLVLALAGGFLLRSTILHPPDLYIGKMNRAEENRKALAVPFVRQKKLYCSEASASMILQYYGYNITQNYVHNEIADRFERMIPPLKQYLSCKYGYYLSLNDLKAEINENDPVMIRLQIGKYRHTVVIVGYGSNFLLVHDPAQGDYLKMDPDTLLQYWEPRRRQAIVITE